MQQPSEEMPPLDRTHDSRDTQIVTQPEVQSSMQLLDQCQSHETNTGSLTCSGACESVTRHREGAALETEPSADGVEDTKELLSEKTEGMPVPVPEEENGRERLKRYRIEVAGRVWIPDIWGQEEMLKDWIDCSTFDASLFPSGIMSARAALAREGRRPNAESLRVEYRC